ncbi:MAG: sugar phosphate nucleotidyltransferase [bacterium]|nr:sugar phosphate nucleotidyltransferase [bacterium]
MPIAGLGTRLLPFSKVIPKAMLPVHNRPSIQWIVEELNEAGITEIIFITSKGQEMVKEYFTQRTWYDEELHTRGHHEHLENLEYIRKLSNFHFVEQKEQLGDGHAILQARNLIDPEEPFFVIFGDCLYHGDDVISKMRQLHALRNRSIIALQEIEPEETTYYGIVGHTEEGKTFIIDQMVEKPEPRLAPSNKAIIGRYLLTPAIWEHLEKELSGSGEIRLIDALEDLQKEEEVYGLLLEGHWLDTGSLEGIQKATEHLRKEH